MAGVNALNGLISFLRQPRGDDRRRDKLCQCPKRANFISTARRLSFAKKNSKMCQCPKRANFISTEAQRQHYEELIERCQCPKRANFISTALVEDMPRGRKRCQCPKRANFISTFGFAYIEAKEERLCQCPKRANFISTITPRPFWVKEPTCVNALNGLISFLQYPLGTRINTGFPGSFLQVFVRIF